jgi:uncharacterized protein YndB with AHSA1/START domain
MSTGMGKVTVTGDDARIEFERTIRAPQTTVWRALTDPSIVSDWLTPGSIDAQTGGELSLDFGEGGVVSGRVLEADPPNRLVYTWVMDGQMNSVVEWTLAEHADGCQLTLVHRTVPVPMSAGYAPGWHAFLDRLEAAALGAPLPDWDTRSSEIASHYSS